MRQIGYGLNHLLEIPCAELVDHQSKDNRHREAENQVGDTYLQSISQNTPEIVALKEIPVVLQSYPLAPEDTLDWLVVLD